MKLIKKKDSIRKMLATILLFAFLVPFILNLLHYAFIEHLPHLHSYNAEIHSYHTTCKLDDYSFGQSSDIQKYEVGFIHCICAEQRANVTILEIVAYRNYTFLLRAPPHLAKLS